MSDSDGVYRPATRRETVWSWVLILGVGGLLWGCAALDDDAPSTHGRTEYCAGGERGPEPC
uniref:Lipoprotein n=1 Tax=Streptomyces sp. NBC_00049 TaxID=2903617 RepID=A0AAU2JIW6_9ACTN